MNNRVTGWLYKCESVNLMYWDTFRNKLMVCVPNRIKQDLPYFCRCQTERIQLKRKPLYTRKRKNNCAPVKIELMARRVT